LRSVPFRILVIRQYLHLSFYSLLLVVYICTSYDITSIPINFDWTVFFYKIILQKILSDYYFMIFNIIILSRKVFSVFYLQVIFSTWFRYSKLFCDISSGWCGLLLKALIWLSSIVLYLAYPNLACCSSTKKFSPRNFANQNWHITLSSHCTYLFSSLHSL